MVFMRGSGSGSGVGGQDKMGLPNYKIREMIVAEVATALQGSIQELFGPIKNVMVEVFDDIYVALTDTNVGTATTAVVTTMIKGRDHSSIGTSIT